jgi:hypothetical protein
MVAEGAIAESELKLLFLTDSVEEAIRYLETHAIEHFHLRTPRAMPWLGEHATATTVPSTRP